MKTWIKFSLLVFAIIHYSLPSVSQFTFLPPGVHFAPLKANIQEPRIGVFKFLDAGEMKVDIGNSIDVFGYQIPEDSVTITAGIDFMAYAYTTGAQGLRLQIDAIDGFFGGNLTTSIGSYENRVYARLRLLHQSAHFVDGHYLQRTQTWLNNRPPIPFTRDFGELVIVHAVTMSSAVVRYYGGISYATLVRPSAVQRFSYLSGAEIYSDKLFGALFSHPVNLFAAYNLTITGTPVYAASHNAQAGIKFGQWYGKGPVMYLAFYNGRHMFAEYFDQHLTTIGLGFTVDFF
jgi:hypothetical protein